MLRVLCFLSGWLTFSGLHAQNNREVPLIENDSIPSKVILFSPSSASEYIRGLLDKENLWRSTDDTLRLSLGRLIDHFNEPFDSVKIRLSGYEYDSVKYIHTFIFSHDTLTLKWLNDSTFIIDDMALTRSPVITQKTIHKQAVDTSEIVFDHYALDIKTMINSMVKVRDTIIETKIDTAYLRSKNIQLHRITDKGILPPVLLPDNAKEARFLTDSTKIVITERISAIVADTLSPFYILPNEKITDSIRYAVHTLLSHTSIRDSVLIYLNNADGSRAPFWMTTGKDDLYRYWVRNYSDDSITIWLGNPSKQDLLLILEDDVNVLRLEKKRVDDVPITTLRPRTSLAKVEPLQEIPVYWKYGLSSAFTLNQTYHSNWARGGQNSLSGMLDVRTSYDYTNSQAKTQWANNGRLRYGTIITEDHGMRTNTDIFEINSQYNRVIKGKFDFTTAFYMKNQIAKGYKYPNDSVVVSKFLNPGTFTIGVGVEYKPDRQTRINLSPLSYKNTFVLDTANINQRTHGVPKDKRAKQEMGGQLHVRNTTTVLDDLKITNSVRLFSGYLDKPQNVDLDWEINLEKRINWYFTVRLNFHMIYDDDVKFPVLDADGEPVLMPDGSHKRVAKMQIKQLLGLTLSFRI